MADKINAPCPDCGEQGTCYRSELIDGKRKRFWLCAGYHRWRTVDGEVMIESPRQRCPMCAKWMKCSQATMQDDGVVHRQFVCGHAGCGHRMTTDTAASDTEMRRAAEADRRAATQPLRYNQPDYHTGERHLAWVGDAFARTLTWAEDAPPPTDPHEYACKCDKCREFWRGWSQRFGFWGPWDERG